MIAVIFEVYPAEGKTQEYLDIAAEQKPLLANIESMSNRIRFKL